ncbi:RNA-binding S4 domain-containing protein [Vibrio genomosp. F10]|uniref:Uncharacterized protein n=1 Tax=Vibrio genomosp. F10 TaxID=723171 RepID=A0A1B9QYU9_9VIBR|nr:RNA-binding S4 domain-containing protein [Vibrio genomosp. F10]OCH75774.1 hypothetical protein A6E14_10480 [Vibrio genomosp. F10]
MNHDQHDQDPNYQEPDYDDASHEEEYDGEEIEIEAIGIDVSSHPIELYKVFKIANLVGGGGEAKHYISEGYVAVNGELETRKRRKMYNGDFFEFNQEYYVVVCDAPVTEPQEKKDKKEKAAEPKASKTSNKSKTPAKKKSSKPAKKETSSSLSMSNRSASKKADSKKADSKKTDSKKAEQPTQTKDDKSGRHSIDFF